MSPKLYKTSSSPPARAVMMLSDILGVKLDTETVNPVAREQDSVEMTEKNPMRTIPTFEDEDGFTLADSHAIMIYLFEKYGRPDHLSLYPRDDSRKVAVINQRLFFDCGVMFPTLRSVMGPTFLGKLKELSNSNRKLIEDSYRILEHYLSKTEYVAGEVMTLADLSAVATASSLDGLHPIDGKRYPNTKRWLTKMCEKDFCKRHNEMGNQELMFVLKTCMEQNKMSLESKL